jgi:hypothetical protein
MIAIPEEVAAATVEACAAWIDKRAREAAEIGDTAEQHRLTSLAQDLRFDRIILVFAVTVGGQNGPGGVVH